MTASLFFGDRVKETTTTTGTGTITLLGAASEFQSFSNAFADQSTVAYTIADQSGTNWEVGYGTFTASGTTLSRDTVLSSSSGGALVSFGAGTKDVFNTDPAILVQRGATRGRAQAMALRLPLF